VIPAYMGLIKQLDDQLGVLFDYLERGGPFHYTRSLNVPIQGSCAEALLEALAALLEAITDLDAAPALCVHDEIILSVAENDAEEAARRPFTKPEIRRCAA